MLELAHLCEALGSTLDDALADPELAATYRRAAAILARGKITEEAGRAV